MSMREYMSFLYQFESEDISYKIIDLTTTIFSKTSNIHLSLPALHFPLFSAYPLILTPPTKEILSELKNHIFSINIPFKNSVL